MAENTTSIPQKGLWTMKAMDWVKGLGLALGTSILALGSLIISNHWRIPPFEVLEPYLDTIGYGFLAYIGKNLTTNNVGQLFKKDQPVVHVDASELASLQQKASQNNTPDIPIEDVTSDNILKKN